MRPDSEAVIRQQPEAVTRQQPDRLATILAIAALAVTPAVFTILSLRVIADDGFAYDFHNQYWPVGRRVLEGLSPYDLGWQDISNHIAFPYDAVAALFFVPFALLPQGFADGLWVGLCFAAVPMTLFLLGVRDWRLYGIVFMWMPVFAGWRYANVSLLLCVAIALLWRSRDRAFWAGLVVAVVVSIKLFVCPLAIWLLATRRYAAFGYAVVCGLALNVAAWMIIGFDQVDAYIDVLRIVSEFETQNAFTLQQAAVDAGASSAMAVALTCVVAAGVGLGGVMSGRRGRERSALLLCITMGFLVTPVTWPHYWALLMVPLALLRPRFSLVWTIPVAMLPVAIVLSVWGLQVVGLNALVAALVFAALRSPARVGMPAVRRLRPA